MKNYILFILILFIFGCQSNKIEEFGRIDIGENKIESILIDDIFIDYNFISLEETDFSLVSSPKKIVLKNDVIFISDEKCIFQFSINEKHLRTLNKPGHGSQEYLSIWDFIVSDKEILIWDQNSRKLIRYSLENAYINSYNLNHYAASIYLINKGEILFSSAYQGGDNYKFIVRNLNTMDIIANFHPITKAQTTYKHVMYQNNYYIYKNTILFHEFMNNNIYKINSHEANPISHIDIYGKNPPEDFWEKEYEHVGDIQAIAQRNGYCYGIPMYAESENQVVFAFHRDEAYLLCSYSKRTKESIQSEKLTLFQGVPAIDVSQIRFNTYSEEVVLLAIESEAFYKDNGTPYAEGLSHLSNNGNPIICIAKLK